MFPKKTGQSPEKSEAQFLNELADSLTNCDFSGKDFRKFGSGQYSLLVDNYQICVAPNWRSVCQTKIIPR